MASRSSWRRRWMGSSGCCQMTLVKVTLRPSTAFMPLVKRGLLTKAFMSLVRAGLLTKAFVTLVKRGLLTKAVMTLVKTFLVKTVRPSTTFMTLVKKLRPLQTPVKPAPRRKASWEEDEHVVPVTDQGHDDACNSSWARLGVVFPGHFATLRENVAFVFFLGTSSSWTAAEVCLHLFLRL